MTTIDCGLWNCVPSSIRLLVSDYLHLGQMLLCPEFFPQKFWREADVADYIIEEMSQGWNWIENYQASLSAMRVATLGDNHLSLHLSLLGPLHVVFTLVAPRYPISHIPEEKTLLQLPLLQGHSCVAGDTMTFNPPLREETKIPMVEREENTPGLGLPTPPLGLPELAPWEQRVISLRANQLVEKLFAFSDGFSTISQEALLLAAREQRSVRTLVKLNDIFSLFEDSLIAAISIEDARGNDWYSMPPFDGSHLGGSGRSIPMLKFVARIGSNDKGVNWVDIIPQLSCRHMSEFGSFIRGDGSVPILGTMRGIMVKQAACHQDELEASFILRALAIVPIDEEIVKYALTEELKFAGSSLLDDEKRLAEMALRVLQGKIEDFGAKRMGAFRECLEGMLRKLPPGSQERITEDKARELEMNVSEILCPLHLALLRVMGVPLEDAVLGYVVQKGRVEAKCGITIPSVSKIEKRLIFEKLLDWSHLPEVRAVLSDGIFADLLDDSLHCNDVIETLPSSRGQPSSRHSRGKVKRRGSIIEEIIDHLNSFPELKDSRLQNHASDSKVGRNPLFVSIMMYPFLSPGMKRTTVARFMPEYGHTPAEVAVNIGAPSIFSAHLRDNHANTLQLLITRYVERKNRDQRAIIVSMIMMLLSDPFYGVGHFLRCVAESSSLADMKEVVEGETSVRDLMKSLRAAGQLLPTSRGLKDKFDSLFPQPVTASSLPFIHSYSHYSAHPWPPAQATTEPRQTGFGGLLTASSHATGSTGWVVSGRMLTPSYRIEEVP